MYYEKDNCAVRRMTTGKLPSLSFSKLKNTILGKSYYLSITFVTTKEAKILHRKYKKKNTPVNVLAFPLERNSGEVVIHLGTARKEAHKFNRTYLEYVGYLLIHAMLHLKGFSHGMEMDEEEKKFCRKFQF